MTISEIAPKIATHSLHPPTLTLAESEAMGQMKLLFEERSWAQLYLHIGGGGPFALDFAAALRRVDALAPTEAWLLRLFGLGLPVPGTPAGSAERSLLAALSAAGLLLHEGDYVKSADFVVAPVYGGQVMMGLPATYARRSAVGAMAYLGTDSLLLTSLLGPMAGRRLLDLGAGCGAQGLLAARGAREAVLTDIDPFSMRVCALNWALNDVAHPVLLAEGDLFEPVAGEQFDVVVVLPPYVPTVAQAGISLTAAGDEDGLGFIRKMLRALPDVLAPGGELVALAQLLCNDSEPLLCGELDSLVSGLETQLVLIDRHPLQPYVRELASRLVAHGHGTSLSQLMNRFESSLRGLGATGICTAALRVRRPLVPSSFASLRIIGPGDFLLSGDVLHALPGVQLAPSAPMPQLQLPNGGIRPLDPVTAALVAAIDGRRNIAEVVTAAWGSPAGARPEQLVEQAALRLAELYEAGLLARGASIS